MAVIGRTPAAVAAGQDGAAQPLVHFKDVAAEAGLEFQHVLGRSESKRYILETTGSGVALFDFDGDGLLDIFLVNGQEVDISRGEPGTDQPPLPQPRRPAIQGRHQGNRARSRGMGPRHMRWGL